MEVIDIAIDIILLDITEQPPTGIRKKCHELSFEDGRLPQCSILQHS